MIDPSATDPEWLRRLPHYLYLADLYVDKRVLEVGCGVGHGARFLANRGASFVLGVDTSAPAIEAAGTVHRLENLEFRLQDFAELELEDGSFDCVCVPEATTILRRPAVLAELRRVLADDGVLIAATPSADRFSRRGGAAYYELVDKLGAFGPVRVFAQAPLVGYSLVEFGDPEAADPAVELDTSLLELDPDLETSDYVAVCGLPSSGLRDYRLVQLPVHGGVYAVSDSIGLVPAAVDGQQRLPGDDDTRVGESTRALADAERRVAELERRLVSSAPAPAPEGPSATEAIAAAMAEHEAEMRALEESLEEREVYIEELRDQLAESEAGEAAVKDNLSAAEERLEELGRELSSWRSRASIAEGQLLRARGSEAAPATAIEVSEASSAVSARLSALEAALGSERELIGKIEEELAALASDEGLPSSSEERKLEELATELGIKDAEITILTIGVSALRQRVQEVVDTVRDAHRSMNGRSGEEIQDLLRELSERLAAYKELG